jgi:hypothetical protein
VDEIPPGIRRVCVAVAVEPDRNGGIAESDCRARLDAAVAEACSSSGLDRTLLDQHRIADIDIMLLPAGIDEPLAVTTLVNGFRRALQRANGPLPDGLRFRLRMAVHEGITTLVASGFTGQAIARACEMLDSPLLRAALARTPGYDLAVIFSEQVFEAVGDAAYGASSAGFERVEIDYPSPPSRDTGWIFVSAS